MLKTFDTGVDWVTTTVPKNDPHYESTWALYEETFQQAYREGHEPKKWGAEGFRGWQAGNVRVGHREEDSICVVSSGAAHQFAIRLGETVQDPKMSRIDIQVTGKGEADADEYIRNLYRILDDGGCKGPQDREMTMALHRSPRRGWTLGFQHRSGDKSGKIYNKTKEQKNLVEPFLHRFEGEFKRRMARLIFDQWRAAGYSRRWCADFVATYFDERGVDMGWVDRQNVVACPSSYTRTTIERQMNWIEHHVARTAREINQQGFEDWQAEQMGFTRLPMLKVHEGVPIAYQEAEKPSDDERRWYDDVAAMRKHRADIARAHGDAAAAKVKQP